MGRIVAMKCAKCDKPFELLRMNGRDTNLGREDDPDNLTCPACDGPGHETFAGGSSVAPHGAGFPYFDLSLGVKVESAQHKRELLKARGLVQLDGEMERVVDEAAAKQSAQIEREREAIERERRRIESDPDLRQAQARVNEAMRGASTPEQFRANLGLRR